MRQDTNTSRDNGFIDHQTLHRIETAAKKKALESTFSFRFCSEQLLFVRAFERKEETEATGNGALC